MRMEQQPLFPGVVRKQKQQRKHPKRVRPPKEERNVLYYGQFIDDDTVIFLEKERAEHNAEIHTAMDKARKAGQTWGEFREKHPKVFKEVWGVLERSGLTTFDEWLKERTKRRGRRRQAPAQAQETTALRDEYIQISRWQRMPLPEEPFDSEVILEHAPSLAAPYDGSEMWIPTEIIDEFGDVQGGFDLDGYVTFKAEDAEKVAWAFRRHGYVCTRNDRLVEKSMGIV